MSYRFLTSMMSLCLLSCAGSTHVEETVSRPRIASSSGASKSGPTAPRKAALPAWGKAAQEPTRDAKAASPELDEEWPPQNFAGVDTTAPKDDDSSHMPREVAIKGIEGTTSEYDVRTTLENRAQDFDNCHDTVGGGGGRIEYRIHILANGDVGGVKVRTMKSRNRKLVDCYTDVVSSSHFTVPHGGYADVKWTTKVGRSRKRPDALFERKVRWDAPAGNGGTRRAEADKSRERRQGRQNPNGA